METLMQACWLGRRILSVRARDSLCSDLSGKLVEALAVPSSQKSVW